MQLQLRIIVPGPAGGTVLLEADGTLPAAAVDGDEDEAAVVAVTAYLRDVLGLRVPVLETHPRWSDVEKGEPIPTLVLTEAAPPTWSPPMGLAFGPIPTGLDAVPVALAPRAGELLEELRTGAEPPPLRPRWARSGWQARASGWMIAACAAARRPLLDEPRPFYLRGISALLRGETATGGVFLKAVFPPFHAEPVVTRLLAERFPASVPRVLAIEADEGWQIVEDLAAPWIGELPADRRPGGLRAGARALVELQRSIGDDDLGPFLAAGCPVRPLADVPTALEVALGPDGVAVVDDTVPPERRDRAVAATRRAVERVAGLGFPTTVVHGDFHAGNAALVGDRAVIIDWSDAAIGNPLIDLVTWLSWSRDDPDQQRIAIDAWVDAWAGPIDPAAIRDRIDDILSAGAAYQVVSYDGIVAALEPATRYTMGGGARHFLERLEEALTSPGGAAAAGVG